MKNIYDKVCRQCGINFKGGPRAFYCPNCRDQRKKEANKRFYKKGRKAERQLGSIDKCITCGKEYIVNSSRQKYCPECAKSEVKKVDRVQGIEYYKNNRDEINLYRTMTRYQLKECVVCGKQFKTKSPRKTCSDECNRILKNQNWMKKYYKKENKK